MTKNDAGPRRTDRPCRVALVDDHALVRESLAQFLGTRPEFEVVAQAADADGAIPLIRETKPDVVLMDIDMPGRVWSDAASVLLRTEKQLNVIVLTAHMHDRHVATAVSIGASGFLSKSERPCLIADAILEVHAGGYAFDENVRDHLVFDERGVRLVDDGSRLAQLSTREFEVMLYTAQGLRKKDMAATMRLSIKTVEHHAERMMAKLGVHDRVQVLRLAVREGLMSP